MYLLQFTVSGRGNFPIDMLRYERCYPVDSESVAAIVTSHKLTDELCEVRLETLAETKGAQPTVARWNSFGWRVLEQSIRKL